MGAQFSMHGCKSRFVPSVLDMLFLYSTGVSPEVRFRSLVIQPGLHLLVSVLASPETIHFRLHGQEFEYWLSIPGHRFTTSRCIWRLVCKLACSLSTSYIRLL